MMKMWTNLAGAAAVALAAPAAAAQQGAAAPATAAPAAAPALPGYTMPQTAMWDMPAESGEIYRIFVSFPASEPPADGWPVLYVLDGNAMFAGFAETRRIQEWSDVGKSIVVGVGYPGNDAYDMRRLYDLTGGPTDSAAYAKFNKERNGGWNKFLDFLTVKLRNEIGTRYKINRDRQALFGHSLGGLFAVHALYSRPDAFHAIIAASPSLFWHEKAMQKAERDFVARLQSGRIPKVARLMVVAGGREEAILERWDPEDFIERMKPLSAWGLRIRSEIYADEGHMTVPNRAVPETLRFAFSWP